LTELFTTKPKPPLAELLRPKLLDEFIGQQHLLGPSNAPMKLMNQMGYREGYRYAHDEPDGFAAGQTYFPDGVTRPNWYQPTDRGVERSMGERLARLRSLDDASAPEAGS